MKADVHTHLLTKRLAAAAAREAGLPEGSLPFLSAEAIWRKTKARGAELVVFRGWPFREHALCLEQNRLIEAAVRALPGRALGFFVVAPHAGGEALAEAERCFEAGFSGLGELDPVRQQFDLDDETFQTLCRLCSSRKKPLALYASYTVGATDETGTGAVARAGAGRTAFARDGLSACTGAVERQAGRTIVSVRSWLAFIEAHRDLMVCFSHYGGGLPFYALMPEIGKRLGNVWFDSAPDDVVFGARARRAAEICVGAGRVLYGSNLPFAYDLPAERPSAEGRPDDVFSDWPDAWGSREQE